MDSIEIIRSELDQASRLLNEFLEDAVQLERINEAAKILSDSIRNGGKVLSCGNGGSHCDAMHFAEELLGRFRDDRKPLPAISISDPSYMSCVSNDYGFEQVFSRAVEGLGNTGDTLLAISTSGNSLNIIKAVDTARSKGIKTILLSGRKGGLLAGRADVEILVPHDGYADRIQEIHIKIIHILIHLVEKELT